MEGKKTYWYKVVKVHPVSRLREGDIYGSDYRLEKENYVLSKKEKDFIIDHERKLILTTHMESKKEVLAILKKQGDGKK